MKITREAIQYAEDLLEEKQAQIDDLEEELTHALEDVKKWKERAIASQGQLARLQQDRRYEV